MIKKFGKNFKCVMSNKFQYFSLQNKLIIRYLNNKIFMSNKIQRVFPKNIPAAIGPYTPAVKVGNMYYVSGQIPVNPVTSELISNNIKDQTHQVMKNIQNALKGYRLGFSDIVKTTILLTDINNFSQVNTIYGSYFKGEFPARICYAVAALPKNSLIEIDAIAYISDQGKSKDKKQAQKRKPKKAKVEKKVKETKKTEVKSKPKSKSVKPKGKKANKPIKTKKIKK